MPVDEENKDKESSGNKKVRRGGRRNAYKERRLTTKDSGLKGLLVTMLKLLAQNTQQLRALRAAVLDTFVVEKKSEIYKALEQEGQAFAAAVLKWRKTKEDSEKNAEDKPPGAPTPHMFIRLLEGLTKMDVGGKNKKNLEDELARLESLGADAPSQLLRDVTLCKFESCYDKGKVKLTLAMRDYSLRGIVLDALTQSGLEYKQGTAAG